LDGGQISAIAGVWSSPTTGITDPHAHLDTADGDRFLKLADPADDAIRPYIVRADDERPAAASFRF
jgi:hypothetical protein